MTVANMVKGIDQGQLLERVKDVDVYVRELRGYLHEHPEVSANEFETTKFLQEEVKKLGLPIEMASNTGFIATMDTGKPGKTVGLRTDIDALPVKENPVNLSKQKKWISKNEGASHVCGHDAHMAILLGTMKILHGLKDGLSGKIVFIFEEGEEIGSGIAGMLDKLKDKGIDAIYGTHVTSFMKTGEICLDAGPRMAGYAAVEFDVVGKSGHGSRPDLSINPVFAAAQVLSGIASAWSNQIDVSKTVTLGLTQIHGGTANNIIPDKVYVGGSLRFFDNDEGVKAVNALKKVTELTATAHNCTVEFANTGVIGTPLINDTRLAEIAQNGVNQLLPESLVHDVVWYASESFSRYSQIAPSVFAFVGVGNEELGSGAEHHNDHFDVDEDALYYGVAATAKFAIDFLNS
ncbi:peptidase m20 [Trichococcus palustris]|jgi:amidohydrolase|uniref:Peptidase m20 n=1 Tax=Trichococcus palustris TaxID=140314 RepID=A0A143YVJ3_9LACT|nr:amidohydrolase [Trichococcus palustris]CZQ98633.1 peptidase m20 [Trichococcus palustris]SFK94277.1 amidohydrolase [Trichococcus palustris]